MLRGKVDSAAGACTPVLSAQSETHLVFSQRALHDPLRQLARRTKTEVTRAEREAGDDEEQAKRRECRPGCARRNVLAALPVRAADETAPAFFQGKQVRFYTMGSPGGGYDTYMRALVPHLEKKLGAKMLPTNEPGAGGLVAINRTINAPPDGLTILLVGGETLVTAQLYEVAGRQLRCAQARLARAGEQRGEGRPARAEVALHLRRRT